MMPHSRLEIAFRAALLAFIVAFAAPAFAVESEIDHLAAVLDLKPGATVADVGAGSGEVSIAIAKFVAPSGTVYATEIDANLLGKIRHNAAEHGASNVRAVLSGAREVGLAQDCCDAIFLREVYHHLTAPLDFDRSLYRALRPGGRLAIIDFDPSQLPGQPVPAGVPANRGGHGVSQRLVEAELSQAGFVPVKSTAWPISAAIRHYCVVFRKPIRVSGLNGSGFI